MPDNRRCLLCGDDFHLNPDPAPGWGNLICPGALAAESVKETYRSTLAVTFADWVAHQASLCQLCGNPWHASTDAEHERFGLRCPGRDGDAVAQDEYRVRLAWAIDREKIETTDWTAFASEAETAYQGRHRVDGKSKAAMPTLAQPSSKELREHCDQSTREVAAGVPFAPGNRVRLELPEPDFDVPHLTVRGEVPRPSFGARPDPHVEDYTLFTKGEHE